MTLSNVKNVALSDKPAQNYHPTLQLMNLFVFGSTTHLQQST